MTKGALLLSCASLFSADASASVGADTSCSNTEYCISKKHNTPGGTDTNMTYGWTVDWWNGSYYALGLQVFSNGGGVVAGKVASIRNRNGQDGDTMCIYDGGAPPNYLNGQAKYYGQTWVNLYGNDLAGAGIFKRHINQLNCPGSI